MPDQLREDAQAAEDALEYRTDPDDEELEVLTADSIATRTEAGTTRGNAWLETGVANRRATISRSVWPMNGGCPTIIS